MLGQIISPELNKYQQGLINDTLIPANQSLCDGHDIK